MFVKTLNIHMNRVLYDLNPAKRKRLIIIFYEVLREYIKNEKLCAAILQYYCDNKMSSLKVKDQVYRGFVKKIADFKRSTGEDHELMQKIFAETRKRFNDN